MTTEIEKRVKRFFDIAVAALGLVMFSPVLIVLIVAIRRTSPGGAFFLQERVGRLEVPFFCVKLRTMVHGTPHVSSHDACQSWITPLGKKLRALKLDEVPQLINVLKGEMSLVGPRPCLPSQHDVIVARRFHDVFDVRPGITGAAQLQGIDMSTPEKLAQVDAHYIRTARFSKDIGLLIATAFGSGKGDAVSR
ncbi:sugar transferase [Rhizobium sp. Leaf262]|uniref:sugar transferase n=1 Tax=Rhizobium sp. Leaf262 TaxID=1736312 RepID=UPI0007135118|nr:sugar transferase [Rhizobium sp. Leaf262]KQO79780.1 lipid carrier--UDP-N-acetylgalactosaminyltransferase [Rhizobium sp. Leaf262]